MRKITTFAISAMALSGLALAEVEAGAYAGFHSNYIFRGADLGGQDAMTDFGLDVGGSCDCGLDWYLGTWYAATQDASSNELDIFAGVTKDLGFGSVDLGYVNYSYMDTNSISDGEIYLGLATEFAGLDLGLNSSFGVAGGWKNGTWIDLTAGYGFDLTDALSATLELGAGFAIGNASYANDVDGLATYSATLALDYTLSDSASLSPYVSYVDNTSDYQTANSLVDGDEFFGGVSLSFAF